MTPANVDLVHELSCGNFGATSVVTDPLLPSDLYAELNCQGVWKSTDYGLTWTGPINIGSGSRAISASAADLAIAPGAPGVPILYSADVRSAGVWKSSDGGVNWVQLIIGPAGNRQDMGSVVVDPSDADHLIAVPHEVTALFQSTDAGASWTTVNMAAGMVAVNGTAALTFLDTGTSSTTRNTWLWLAQGTGGAVGTWRTADGGATWTRVDNNEKPHGGFQAYQPDTGGVIYMPGLYSALGHGVLRSSDYGQTWSHVGGTAPEAAVFGTPNNVYAMYGWACQYCVVEPNYELAPQPGISGWSSPRTPRGMSIGADTAAVTWNGTNYIVVTANYNAGMWRYVEPAIPHVDSPTAVPTQEEPAGQLAAGSSL